MLQVVASLGDRQCATGRSAVSGAGREGVLLVVGVYSNDAERIAQQKNEDRGSNADTIGRREYLK